jgi:N-acetylmuramoyl-L-alanine amidase
VRHGLEGVVVILDPGHGGRDLGTMNNGIWEHDYVYDVSCRLKQRLESQTAAKVYLTLEDEKTGCVPSRTDKLKANRQGTVQTHPPFLAKENGEARIGVNLRWYLANSIYRREVSAGVDPDKIVFLSIHADARHPSLAGVMVYVPGAIYIGKTHGFKSRTYTRYAEVREKQYVSFSKKQRVRSEAVSQKFAEEIVRTFRNEDLPVQPYQPVRNRIIRGRSIFVPAVLRGNAVPTKVLVEMVNLSNSRDAALLASARDRDRLADALYQALFGYFGSSR